MVYGIIGGFCELVRNIYDFLCEPTPLKSQIREKMGTHYSPGGLGGEEDRHLSHWPFIFTVNPLDSFGRTLPRCKGPGKMNGAGLRSRGVGGWDSSPMCFGIPWCHCHLHSAEKTSGAGPRCGRDRYHSGPMEQMATVPNVFQGRWGLLH